MLRRVNILRGGYFTNLLSGPDRAIGSVCVCVFGQYLLKKGLDIWYPSYCSPNFMKINPYFSYPANKQTIRTDREGGENGNRPSITVVVSIQTWKRRRLDFPQEAYDTCRFDADDSNIRSVTDSIVLHVRRRVTTNLTRARQLMLASVAARRRTA